MEKRNPLSALRDLSSKAAPKEKSDLWFDSEGNLAITYHFPAHSLANTGWSRKNTIGDN